MVTIDVSDIAQYLYCPRKIYFIKVMGLRILKPKMEMGKEIHEGIYDKLRRRKRIWRVDAEIVENVYLESEKYGIRGYVDAVLKCGEELIPVDVKYTKFDEIFYNWKMQLVAYAVLVEENFRCVVKKVLVYLTETNDWVEVSIFPEDREALKRIIKKIEGIILNERYPPATKSKKCEYCEMLKICH
jgi:CRISPR-associated exonuclease Cas4